mmetsp:Transcript_91420/g.258884  ORF Transcript_91420/g.258884 Transcript_91420/m.258884 type:complete len:211 (+) Transcript_91420:301-933(+)
MYAIMPCLPRPRKTPPNTPWKPSTTAKSEAMGVSRAVRRTTGRLSLKTSASSSRSKNMTRPVADMKDAPRMMLSTAARRARGPSPAPMRFPTRIVAAIEIPSGKERKQKPATVSRMLCASRARSLTWPAKTVMASKLQASNAIMRPPARPMRASSARPGRSRTRRGFLKTGASVPGGGRGAGVQRACTRSAASIAQRVRDRATGAPTKPQ